MLSQKLASSVRQNPKLINSMKLACFPCEIQHREFDSKLLLAMRIVSKMKGDCAVLIGYDKYFSPLLNSINNVFLLDKSMSTIMYNARIKPCKLNGGIVFINDEEGVNDLDETPEALAIPCNNSVVDRSSPSPAKKIWFAAAGC